VNNIRENLIFIHNGSILDSTKCTVGELGIKSGDDLLVVDRVDKRKTKELDKFPIQILFADERNRLLKLLIIPSSPNADVSVIRNAVIKHLNLERGGFELVFDGTVLSDGETLKGIDYRQGQNIALLIRDKWLSGEVVYIPAFGTDLLHRVKRECYSMKQSLSDLHADSYRIITNKNFNGHRSKHHSEECKMMIQVVVDSWRTIFTEFRNYGGDNDHDNRALKIYDESKNSHAMNVFLDMHELCDDVIMSYPEKERELFEPKKEQLYDDQFDLISELLCGSIENENHSNSDTVIILGPPRDEKMRLDLPRIKLRYVVTDTTTQDLIDSYKVYANLADINISLKYNGEILHPESPIVKLLESVTNGFWWKTVDSIYINVVKKKKKQRKRNLKAHPVKEMDTFTGTEKENDFSVCKNKLASPSKLISSVHEQCTSTEERLLLLLKRSIEEKETDLECPVCLEVAEVPIYSCHESHVICNSCMPKLTSCPVCRQSLKGKGKPRRHRYAEKSAEELKRLREELDIIKT